MSIVENYKSEFKIVCFDEDIKRGESQRELLKGQGFQIEVFSSRGLFLESLNVDLPHVFLLYYQPLSTKFREILDAVRSSSNEVQIIVLGSKEFWPGIHNLIKNGQVNDYWSWPMAGEDELSLRLERLIEKDIYRFIAEQRSEATAQIMEKIDQLQEKAPAPIEKTDIKSEEVMHLIGDKHRTEPEIVRELIDNLKKDYPNSEFIYFKNYASRNQLLVTRTSFSSDNYFRGQSVAFSEESLRADRSAYLNSLRDQISESFSVDEFAMQPVEFAGEFFGLIMAVHFEGHSFLKKASRYLSMTLRNFNLENSGNKIEIDNDLEVGIPKSQFPFVLSREVSRGRRLKLPVSLIIGHFEYIADQKQEFKATFEQIKSSLREYDYICQFDENRMAIILPHCSYEDGAIKAETLRRQLVSRGLKTQNTALRLCFGVSEYPALSQDSTALLTDAEKACGQVLVSGKNKVCLYTAEENFEPEFQPQKLS